MDKEIRPYVTPTIENQILHIWHEISCPACERSTCDCTYITKSGHLHLLFVKYTPTGSKEHYYICSSCYEFIETVKAEENIREDWFPEIEQLKFIIQHPDLFTNPPQPSQEPKLTPVAKHIKLGRATEDQVLLAYKACQAKFPNQFIPRDRIPLPETDEEKSIMSLMIRMLSDYALEQQNLDDVSPVPNSIKRGTFKNRAVQCYPFYKQNKRSDKVEAVIDTLIKRGLIVEHFPPNQRGRQGRYLSSPYVNPVHPDLFEAIRNLSA